MTDLTALSAGLTKTVPDQKLRDVAQELEVHFLSVMLKEAGVGRTPDGFGGGAGEDQFTSFLRDEQARAMVQAGGLGLAEMFFQSLKERENAQ